MSTRALRVIHVDTERGWRGGERQAFWLAERLMWKGHRSVLAVRAGEPLAKRAEGASIPIVPLAPFGEMDVMAALSLRRAIVHEDADIVHAHTGHAVALAALATMRTRARMVLTRRVSFPLKRNPASLWKYARADAMIAVCRATADALVASGIESARITVAYSGVDLTRVIPPASPETLASLGVKTGAPLVVMVAALVGHKDPLTFVRAIEVARRSVPDVQALMVGEGDLRAEVEREIAMLGLSDTVHLAGYRTDADSLMSVADVVALSSRDDGIGGVVIDAMSFGKPVAATAAGGIPEAVVNDETGLLVPIGDVSALGAAIARLLIDRELAGRLGANGVRRAPLFSIDNTVDRTLEVYERVLSSRPR
ncbi:MAG: glycosyltransferase family 4 protein [Gemmatimonadota bacterium]|nr:glycosyltransferase family 4 protein [Gemmatimonadota bacterium]